MSQINVLDIKGNQVGKAKLEKTIFSVELNQKLIDQATVTQLANSRQSNAHTKTRGEVRGGGAKPWRQKGTGRARAGSSNSPIWIGGGTVFGPKNNRNYKLMINKKMKRKALFMALTDKVESKKLIVIDKFEIKEPKTKLLVEILNTLPTKDGSILIVLPKEDINIELAAANVPYVKLIKLSSINIIDVIKFDYVLTSQEGIDSFQKLFGCESTEESQDKPEVKEKSTETKKANSETKTEKKPEKSSPEDKTKKKPKDEE